ncbi:MAG: isocitrate lyase/phosphoenolpyruvate mutase family protein [Proteobacteria bacterium]|nr:isocitrate lyase/phosphoenolpyruvate mutase family protein [Pseudomonadota bacterium]
MNQADGLRHRLSCKPIVVTPGICDAFTALIAEKAGFSTLYVSGAGIAYTRLGRPDVGLVSMSEVAETIALIRERVDAHLIVDADTGYGNALNVERTVRLFERVGANAVQIEDQEFPKRCGHLDGKVLVPTSEMVGKIKAALDARRSGETLVIARTDAVAVEGFESAIARAAQYREAGADILFVEAPRTQAELSRIAPALGAGVLLMANMVEGGRTPMLSAAELEGLGFALVIFPGGIVRAFAQTASDYYASLATHGTTQPLRARMLDFERLNALIGAPEMIARAKRYEAPPSGKKTGDRR